MWRTSWPGIWAWPHMVITSSSSMGVSFSVVPQVPRLYSMVWGTPRPALLQHPFNVVEEPADHHATVEARVHELLEHGGHRVQRP